MRVIRRSESEEDQGMDITPLIDIVFIMLIFFIVTASFVKESGVEIDRPKADTAVMQSQGSILIGITEADEVWINHQPVDVRSVHAHVMRLQAENPQGGVVIQADRDSRNDMLVQVMDQIRQAGVEKIALAASPDQQ